MSISENQNKSSLLLLVVVSCKGVDWILKKNLTALKSQDLDRRLWEPLFLFREEQKDSSGPGLIQKSFPLSQSLFLPKSQALYEMRNLAFRDIHTPYIYFIDEDVILEDTSHLSRLVAVHKDHPEWKIIGAGYLNHPKCSFWGRSYNWLSGLWIKKHKNFVPAGNLSIKTSPVFKARFYSPEPFGFGGEEVFFLKALYSEGHKTLYKEELSVRHLAVHTFRDFLHRAWIHGPSFSFDPKGGTLNGFLFSKEKASFSIKISALFYLILVRISSFFYKRIRK